MDSTHCGLRSVHELTTVHFVESSGLRNKRRGVGEKKWNFLNGKFANNNHLNKKKEVQTGKLSSFFFW